MANERSCQCVKRQQDCDRTEKLHHDRYHGCQRRYGSAIMGHESDSPGVVQQFAPTESEEQCGKQNAGNEKDFIPDLLGTECAHDSLLHAPAAAPSLSPHVASDPVPRTVLPEFRYLDRAARLGE